MRANCGGVKTDSSVQFVPCASVTGIGPQVPVPLKVYSGSDGVALEITSEWTVPVLYTVTVFVTV